MWEFLNKLNIDVWCICLMERDDKYNIVKKEFKKVGLINHVKFHRPYKHAENGRIGCFNSHKFCMFNSLNKNKHSLVFEDDVQFSDDWEDKLNSIKIFLYSGILWDILKFGSAIDYIIKQSPIKNICNYKSFNTHAILYNTKLIQKYKNDVSFNPNVCKLHIDQLFRADDDIMEYGLVNSMCYQRYCESDNIWKDKLIHQKIWQSKFTILIQKTHNNQKKLCMYLPFHIQKHINIIDIPVFIYINIKSIADLCGIF